MKSSISAIIVVLVTSSLRIFAGSFDEATVSRVVNEVQVVAGRAAPRPLAGHETFQADAAVHVGPQSRAELGFADHTLARLGAETQLGLRRGTRELRLERGTLLLEVPGFRGGARVRAGPLTAVCGAATVLIEHLPAQSLKIVVLAGDLRVSTGGIFGDSLVIAPGKMLITGLDVKRIPDPVDVDLGTLVKTSGLISATAFPGAAAPLASLPRIEREVARQAAFFKAKRLIPTNLAIVGSGTNVVIPGQPSGETAGGSAAGESLAEVDLNDATAGPKPAGIAVHQAPAESPDGENSPPEQ